MMDKIYQAFLSDPLIKEKVGKKIKFYEYPAAEDGKSGPFIIIDPLDASLPSAYADNEWLKNDYMYQIEVWSSSKVDTDAVADRVQMIMWKELGFSNYGGGMDEWDRDYNIYRVARRYRGQVYKDSII